MKAQRIADHAIDRLRERGISPQQVQAVLSNPDRFEKQANGRIKAEKKIDGRILKVIYKDEPKVITLVSAMWG